MLQELQLVQTLPHPPQVPNQAAVFYTCERLLSNTVFWKPRGFSDYFHKEELEKQANYGISHETVGLQSRTAAGFLVNKFISEYASSVLITVRAKPLQT